MRNPQMSGGRTKSCLSTEVNDITHNLTSRWIIVQDCESYASVYVRSADEDEDLMNANTQFCSHIDEREDVTCQIDGLIVLSYAPNLR